MAIFTAIASAIASALFVSASAIALATTLIASALAFGVQLAFSYLNRSKKRTYSAVQGETQFGGDVPVGTIFGISKVKGQRAYYAKYGKGNKYNAEVFILANGWCDGLEPYVYFYGEKKELLPAAKIGNEAARYTVNGYGGNITFRFYDGRPNQQVDMALVNATVALGQRWKITSTGAGLCYVIVERLWDKDLFPTGKPDIEFVLRGLREYDPRKDSTVAGGSGPQRINDKATWVHTRNPAVHRLNYQLGLRAEVSGRTLIGEGKSLGQLDLGTYFVAMNVCDSLRKGKPTYQCSIYVQAEDDHTEILKEFDDAMAGYGVNRRGLSGIIVGAPQIPVMELTAEDIPLDRPKDIQFRKSAFDRFNHLAGQFTSIDSMWNAQSLTPVVVNADIAADGRNKQATNDFLQVTDADIAQYLLNIRYRQNRLGASATVPVSRRVGLKVQEGEWIEWRERVWLISEWNCDEQFRFSLKLSETSASIYDDGDIEPGPVVIPPTPPVNPSVIATVSGLAIATGILQGADGYEQPTLRFTWVPPEDPTITQVRFEYRINGRTQVYTDASVDPESGEYVTSKDVQSGVIYDVRATITTVPDRFRTFTPWVTSVDATGFSSVKANLNSIGQDAKSVWVGIAKDLRDMRARLEQLGIAFILEGSVAQVARDEIRVDVGNSYAAISEERRVRTSENESLAQLITTVEAVVEDNTASIIEETLARTTEDEALASQITAVSANIGDISAEGMVQFKAVAAPSGVDVRYAVLLRTDSGDTFKESGFYVEIYTQGGVQKSRASFNVDQFSVTNDVNTFALFAIEGGIVKMLNAMIDQAQIRNLFVNGNQIEPAAASFMKATRVANSSGGAYDFVIKHGLNQENAHHEIRLDFSYTVVKSGTGSVQGLIAQVVNLNNNETIWQDIIGLNGGESRSITKFRYYPIPASLSNTETTLRMSFSSVSLVSWSDLQLGGVVTKNVPNNI